MTRDVDKALVYAAEDMVFDNTIFAEPFGPQGLLGLAVRLNGLEWWQSVGVPFSIAPTRRESGHSTCSFNNDGAVLRFSLAGENAATFAHEAAHLVAQHHGATPAHGPLFRAAELDVVTIVCGPVAAERLREVFLSNDLLVAARKWIAPRPVGELGLVGIWQAESFRQAT